MCLQCWNLHGLRFMVQHPPSSALLRLPPRRRRFKRCIHCLPSGGWGGSDRMKNEKKNQRQASGSYSPPRESGYYHFFFHCEYIIYTYFQPIFFPRFSQPTGISSFFCGKTTPPGNDKREKSSAIDTYHELNIEKGFAAVVIMVNTRRAVQRPQQWRPGSFNIHINELRAPTKYIIIIITKIFCATNFGSRLK